LEILAVRPGFVAFKATGKKAVSIFELEAGGHRWQRIPPTEKRGRIQTSTITVAALSETKANNIQLNPKDLIEQFTRGSGPGGQHRNKTSSAVHLKHVPTGLKIFVDDGRSQKSAREAARELLKLKLQQQEDRSRNQARSNARKQQIGSGMRGDKIRTIQTQNNTVVDHRTGKRTSYKKYVRGKFAELR